MKILLTHGYFLAEDPKEREIMRPYVPLGMLYISAWLEKHGYDNEVFDSTFSSFNELTATLEREKPDVVGIYVNLMTKLNVLRIIQAIRASPALRHTRIILGGPEVRNHVDNFLKSGADFIVLGEGEETMLDLVKCIETGGDYREVAGLAFVNADGNACYTAERPLMKDLSVLPYPNREKVDLNKYFRAWKQKHGTSAVSVNTMRGCPYTCKWCSRAVYGMSYRRRSAADVVAEMKWLHDHYDVDSIWFVDDVFTINHKWLREFAAEVQKAQLHFPYECITRADRMNEEVINLLKESGCFRVWIGAESGSQKIIDLMDRRVEVGKVREMIQKAQAGGIQAGTFIMVGYPGETESDIRETVRHLKESDPDLFTITIAYPIKGTGLYEEVEPDFIEKLPWDSSTDRDIDFTRTYPRKYYHYAVRMIVNEVNAHKAVKQGQVLLSGKLKAKSLAARFGMLAVRRGMLA